MKKAIFMALIFAFSAAFAYNRPCSGSKGGISHCEGGKFICNDGSVSASKRLCDPAIYGGQTAQKTEKASASDKASCLVVGISDGDTIAVRCGKPGAYRMTKVRVSAIDAPERRQAFGRSAREALAGLCFREYARITTVDTDRYGRKVADVECKGEDVGRFMVSRGLAWVYDQYARGHEYLYPLQEEAKSERRGLWQDKQPIAPWIWRSKSK